MLLLPPPRLLHIQASLIRLNPRQKPALSSSSLFLTTRKMAGEKYDSAKRNAAIRAVADHFDPTAKYIGIGSGTTIVFVVEQIAKLKGSDPRISDIAFIPTGTQSRKVVRDNGLKDINFDALPKGELISVAFDGADEIDEDFNLIKGGGACLYQEKLVATHARKFVVVGGTFTPLRVHSPPSFFFLSLPAKLKASNSPGLLDHRKLQPRLLTSWPTIPIEVEPLSAPSILSLLQNLGSPNPAIRPSSKSSSASSSSLDGNLLTDQNNYIIDAPFPALLLRSDVEKSTSLHPTHKGLDGLGNEGGKWEVEALAREIKLLEGVLSVGIFAGENGIRAEREGRKLGGQKPVAIYCGMGDGSVEVRNSSELVED